MPSSETDDDYTREAHGDEYVTDLRDYTAFLDVVTQQSTVATDTDAITVTDNAELPHVIWRIRDLAQCDLMEHGTDSGEPLSTEGVGSTGGGAGAPSTGRAGMPSVGGGGASLTGLIRHTRSQSVTPDNSDNSHGFNNR